MTFIQALRKAGFNKLKQHRSDISPYGIGNNPGKERYAEIISYDGWKEVWVVGKDIKHTGTLSYPGGKTFQDAKELDKYLQSLPKL